MTVDLFASERHFLDHLAPVWNALPESERGVAAIGEGAARYASLVALGEHATHLGLEPSPLLPRIDRPVVVASVGDLRRARRFGRTQVALLEHGSGQSFGADPRSARQPSYPGGTGRDASLFLAPNDHASGRDRAAYPRAIAEVVGCPKLDALPPRASRESRPVVAVSFHWDCMVCAETRSGWRQFRAAVIHLARSHTVIGHGHPRIIDELAREYRSNRIELVRDFADVVRRADVYVNEGSSTLFEAAAAGIPVVTLEPSFFRRSLHHGLRFWDAAHVGVSVAARNSIDTSLPKKLLAAVDEALADPPDRRRDREAALSIVYRHRSGASVRAADAIGRWASARVEAVA